MNQIPPVEKPKTEKFYPLTHSEWVRIRQELKPAERDLLLYLRTLDPFGNAEIEIGVRSLAETLGYSPSTVSRALKALDAKGFIVLDLIHVRIKVKNCKENQPELLPTDSSVAYRQHLLPTDNTRCLQTTPVASTQHQRSPEPNDSAIAESEKCTKNKSLNCLNRSNSPTPVENREPIGTTDLTLKQLSSRCAGAGIEPNDTIKRELVGLINVLGCAEATRLIRNALSSIQEQQAKNKVRNPHGMLMTAIRRGFTSNEEKKEVRKIKRDPDVIKESQVIDQAMRVGDRQFVIDRLRSLWTDGFSDLVSQLWRLRPDWDFVIGDEGPQWRQS
jgi:DNA-binding transcriptional ArsR family regulator